MQIALMSLLFFGCFLFSLGNIAHADTNRIIDQEDRRQWPHPLWQSVIESKHAKLRQRSAVALGRLQRPDVVPALLKLAKDPVASVRVEAIFALGQLAWDPQWTTPHTPAILEQLRTVLYHAGRDEERKVAIEALGKYAPSALPTWLRPILEGKNHRLQAEAWLALFRFRLAQKRRHPKKAKATSQPTSQPTSRPHQKRTQTVVSPPPSLPTWVWQRMQQQIKHPNARVRRNIAYYFARTQDPEGTRLLIPLAQDQNLWVRFFALFALQRLKPIQAKDVGLLALQHPSYIIRVAGIQLMQAIKHAHVLPSSLQRDPSFHVRTAWAQAQATATQVDLYALQKLAHIDTSITVRTAAIAALAKHRKDELYPILLEWLKQPQTLVREAAVQASRYLQQQKMSFLHTAYRDTSPLVRAAVLEQLANIATPEAFTIIQKALRSPHLAERGHAVYALRSFKNAKFSPLIWQTYLNSRDSRWLELREDLIDLIGQSPHPSVVTWLQKALRDPAHSVATKAQQWLKKKGIHLALSPQKHALTFSPYRHFRFEQNPVVILVTNRGVIEIECYAQEAPIHVANFVGLARRGFYNNLTWHRVVSNFVIQGGDPDGSGWGDGGFQLRAEVNRKRFHRGVVGMPRAQGWNTGSVQIFITHTPTPHLDGQYTVFGKVIRGLHIIDQIERGDVILRADVKNHAHAPR